MRTIKLRKIRPEQRNFFLSQIQPIVKYLSIRIEINLRLSRLIDKYIDFAVICVYTVKSKRCALKKTVHM